MPSSVWTVVLECGAWMSVVAGGYLLVLLRVWPKVFLRHYPRAVREAVGPLSPSERRRGILVSLPFLAALVAFPAWAAYRAGSGGSGFGDMFLAAYGTGMVFNLVDWLVLDELVIGALRPGWLVLPGAEHIPLRFEHRQHAIGFLKGAVGGAVAAVLIAAIVAVWV